MLEEELGRLLLVAYVPEPGTHSERPMWVLVGSQKLEGGGAGGKARRERSFDSLGKPGIVARYPRVVMLAQDGSGLTAAGGRRR